ncbi:hypothetical protein C8Q70DRAFT_946353 [Cubamyces menziesii]|nr:hypothetical protein C8Q70DRAFT_946353 [Cubamyces menziesii]
MSCGPGGHCPARRHGAQQAGRARPQLEAERRGDAVRRQSRAHGRHLRGELFSPEAVSAMQREACGRREPFERFATDIPSTDILCRPAPGEESTEPLRAHEAVLSVHSTVLKARLAGHEDPVSSDRASGSPLDSPPCRSLHFDEDEAVVSALLTVCYHGRASLNIPRPLTMLTKLLKAEEKYDMKDIAHWTQAAWDERAFHSPLEAYFAAIANGLEDHAKGAALKAVERPLLLTSAYISVMETTSAPIYHRFLKFIDAYRQVVQSHYHPLIQTLRGNISPAKGIRKSTPTGTIDLASARSALHRLEDVSSTGAPGTLELETLEDILRSISKDMLLSTAQAPIDSAFLSAVWQLPAIPDEIRRASATIVL